jgi:ribosomal protein L29
MAEETKKPKKEKKQIEVAPSDKSLKDLRAELQKIHLDIITGRENNTSKKRGLRKEIARKLTDLNKNK